MPPGRSRAWTRDDAAQGRPRARDLIEDDLTTARPIWALSCYGPREGEPNLLGGDTSPEEARARAYAAAVNGERVSDVNALVRSIAEAKTNDGKGILAFPEQQLAGVLERVRRGAIAPAGAGRVVEQRGRVGTVSPSLAIAHEGFSGAINRNVSSAIGANALGTFGGGGFAGGGFAGGGFAGGGLGLSANEPPLAPDPGVANSEAWCASSFASGSIPDEPPPPRYIR